MLGRLDPAGRTPRPRSTQCPGGQASFVAPAFVAGAFVAGAFVAGAFVAGAFVAGAFFAGAFFAAAFAAGVRVLVGDVVAGWAAEGS